MPVIIESGASGGRSRLAVAGVLTAALIGAGLAGVGPAHAVQGNQFGTTIQTDRGAVASVHPLASRIGIDVLNEGGNAIDAAVATAFALSVVRPDMTGIGGGGFMVYRSADGSEVAALDFREAAPNDVSDVHFRDGDGIDDVNVVNGFGPAGHRVVGVPGMVAGLTEALDAYGTKSLERVIRPAAGLARNGFVVSAELAENLTLGAAYLRLFPETSRTFYPHSSAGIGQPTDPVFTALIDNAGDTFWLKQKDLAASLDHIAVDGADAFYRGSIADQLVAEFDGSGVYPGDAAKLTHEDLASYRAEWRKPLRTNYRGNEIIGAPLPTSGGIVLAETLNILEGFDLAGKGPSSLDHLHDVTEATKIALADRALLGDVDDGPLTARLTSTGYASQRRAEIDPSTSKIYGASDLPGSGHTTHVSVIDEAGNAVSMTLSLNTVFGSGVVAKDTGILLNNTLDDFDMTLADPAPPNTPGPGKRPLSSGSPTLVVRGGKTALAIGGAGGPGILRGVPQAVINFIDFGMDAAHAIDAERIFPANEPAPPDPDDEVAAVDVLTMEGDRIDAQVIEDLRGLGHRISDESAALEYDSRPILEGVGRLPTGWLQPYSDPRSENGAMVQPPTSG
jgi:gamma-glutamyltranspeptidase / glutathione hydrolase